MRTNLSAIGMKRHPLALAIALLLGSTAALADDARDPADLLGGGVSIIITESAGVTTEAGGAGFVSFRLSDPPTNIVQVVVTSSDTTEGQVQNGSIQFDMSNWNVAQQVVVVGQDDAIFDGDIAYNVNLVASSIDGDFNGRTAQVGFVNLDNESASFIITDAADLETTEAGGTGAFSVALSDPPLAGVNVAFVSIVSLDTTEGRVTSASTLAFTASNWNVAQQVIVTGQDDAVFDGDVGYLVEVRGGAQSGFNNLSTNVAFVNLDNEVAPALVITQAPNLQTSEAGTNAVFSVALSARPEFPVNVAAFSSDSTEGVVQGSGALVFAPGNWNIVQQVVVIGQDDAVVDGDISYLVQLLSFSDDAVFDNLRTNVSLVNLDNDAGGGDPILTTQSINRTQGSPRFRSTIGSVSDAGGAGAVNITVNGGSSANLNGVEVQVLRNSNGTISALVRAGCLATNTSFTITANNGTTSNSRQLDVFVATGGNPLWCQWWPR